VPAGYRNDDWLKDAGEFYGCKLHIVMNQFGEISCSALSNGHVADIKMVEQLVDGFASLQTVQLHLLPESGFSHSESIALQFSSFSFFLGY